MDEPPSHSAGEKSAKTWMVIASFVISVLALVLAVPAGVIDFDRFAGIPTFGEAQSRAETEMKFVRALESVEAGRASQQTVRGALTYVREGSAAQSLVDTQMNLYAGYAWAGSSAQDRRTAVGDGGAVRSCAYPKGQKPTCHTFSDFSFDSAGRISDLRLDGAPISALLLPAETKPRNSGDRLEIRFGGGRFSVRQQTILIALFVYNNSDDVIKIDSADALYFDTGNRQLTLHLAAPATMGPGQRSWFYGYAQSDSVGWVEIPITRSASSGLEWYSITVG